MEECPGNWRSYHRRVVVRTALLLVAALPWICSAQAASPEATAGSCEQFLGLWEGAFSQGQYGTQRIEVKEVSDQCLAKLVYNPIEGRPETVHVLPIRSGAMVFPCSVPGGRCHLVHKDGELAFRFEDPSGFVNTGVFRKVR